MEVGLLVGFLFRDEEGFGVDGGVSHEGGTRLGWKHQNNEGP